MADVRTTLAPFGDIISALKTTKDPAIKKALEAQLAEWVKLAERARLLVTWLVGTAIALLGLLVILMAWTDLFDTSRLWELSFVIFALAVFVASPLAVFILERPLAGIDKWTPTFPKDGGDGAAGKDEEDGDGEGKEGKNPNGGSGAQKTPRPSSKKSKE